MIDAVVRNAVTEVSNNSPLDIILYLKYSAGIVKVYVKELKTLYSI